MRHLILALVALLLAVPAGATEPAPAETRAPEVVPSVATGGEAVLEASLRLREVRLEERAAPADAAAAQLGPRGGFWWTVGVIVVAGVILALVL